jgi:radical SAM superfamily enzyme YgiQ (UPF0313 family)
VLRLALPDGRTATLTLRSDATVLAMGETDVSSYDLAGRPYVLVRGDVTARRALDGRLLHKEPARDGHPRLRRVVSATQGESLVEEARREAAAALAALGSAEAAGESGPEATRRLERIVATDAAALRQDAARFASLYHPIGILPPDQYLALVLQATEGCSWNACTFCALYRGTPFRVKAPEEFEAHLQGVRAYFGDSIPLRHSLFLGDANALCAPTDRVLPLMEAAVGAFPEAAAGGIHAFVDAWSGRRRVAEYEGYARLGLRRVYVGLETGDPHLLSWLRKPGTPEDAQRLVEALHEAGIAVGLIVLLGAGGERYFNTHARRTAELLAQMELGPEDIVYFSELVEHPTADYARRAEAEGIEPLAPERLLDQRRSIEMALGSAFRARRAAYDVREFVY